MQDYKIPNRPQMLHASDNQRIAETSRRRRMLDGTWEPDLMETLRQHLSPSRVENWGVPDLSTNLLETITRDLAKLYHETPTVTHPSANIERLTARNGLLQGLWPMMQSAQQAILAMRECVIRIDHVPAGELDENGTLQYRIVTPDFLYLEASPSAPDIPFYYQEYRIRSLRKKNTVSGKMEEPQIIWTVDIFDIRNKSKPVFKICEVNQDGTLGEDLTKQFLGTAALKGDKYPYRYQNGFPFIPCVLYHAEKTGKLWNAYDKQSLVEGSLNSALLNSFWLHICKSCSYEQRYIAGLTLSGLEQRDMEQTARRAEISTDTSSILVFKQDADGMAGQPLIGSWSPSVDPGKFMEAIHSYERRIASSFSISSSLLRESGDPRSGYSLSISRDGQRQAQRIQAPTFRVYDSKLIQKIAAMANIFLGESLPEDRLYRVNYAPIPLSATESKELRDNILQLVSAGLMSPIQAYQQLNPDTDEIQAKLELEKIRQLRQQYQM